MLVKLPDQPHNIFAQGSTGETIAQFSKDQIRCHQVACDCTKCPEELVSTFMMNIVAIE